ncbi:hypothetical protein ABT034_11395 [Streptomyces sp. NPDC002773]|uniref:hypothetical protein n=1 Tax=Streptomyces sp. NPDC002773 TaxID=3154430 RepID=UPI00331D463C
MKQSAAKKLGVAALGAAFAATAAGTASAAPSLPLGADVLGTVTQAVPLGDGLTELPDGASESLGAGQGALGQGLDQGAKNLPTTTAQATKGLPLDGATGALGGLPISGLLGGLPLGAGGLPIG